MMEDSTKVVPGGDVSISSRQRHTKTSWVDEHRVGCPAVLKRGLHEASAMRELLKHLS
jgi:hypothetical protein